MAIAASQARIAGFPELEHGFRRSEAVRFSLSPQAGRAKKAFAIRSEAIML
jgi:hypothetical protein